MKPVHFSFRDIRLALCEGWQITQQTRVASIAYASIFALLGALIIGLLLINGFTPFIIAAAGAFMLIGPVTLAGFFGIAQAHENGQPGGLTDIRAGFARASSAIWIIASLCALLFMIFMTDAATLYSFMVGRSPVWFSGFSFDAPGIRHFMLWGLISGLAIAFMLYCISVFAVPLLCERRNNLVSAISISVRAVFGNFIPAMAWAGLLASLVMGSILLLPLFPLILPWLAHASRALYRRVLPP
jgi:uncharacterized membrane protein